MSKGKNHFELKVGNYWLYRTKITFPDDSYQILDDLDSVWIAGTTSIAGREYYILESQLDGISFIRDSADCVMLRQLTLEEVIYSTNRDTLFRDREHPIVRIMTDVNQTTEVLAGRFRTSNCRTLLRKSPSDEGHDSYFPVFDANFYTAQQYICSEGIGIIKGVHYYLGNRIENELVRFNVN